MAFFSGEFSPDIMKRERDEDESKLVRRFGMGGTIRREGFSKMSALNARIGALARKVKMANPLHMVQLAMTAFAANTTGTISDICNGIASNDEYNGRYGTRTRSRRLIITGTLIPGSTAATPSTVRIVVLRAQVGSAVAGTVPNLTVSCNPIADNGVQQVYCDKLYTVAAPIATAGYGTKVFIKCKLYSHQTNYISNAAGSQSGESIFIVVLSDKAPGTTAPVFQSGHYEHWYMP